MCTSRCCCVGLATVYRLALISRFSPFVHNTASAIFMYDLTHVGERVGMRLTVDSSMKNYNKHNIMYSSGLNVHK